MTFYVGLGVVITVLSVLVIWSDAADAEQRLEDKIRAIKTERERDWEVWAGAVEQLITASCPPEEREWRLKQFYRDNPKPGL